MVKKLNVNSAYKEACKLDLSVITEDEIEIHVILMNAERFKHREIGVVKLGRYLQDDVHKTGEMQWLEAFDNPGEIIPTWHPLFPHPPIQLAPGQRVRSRSRSPSPGPGPTQLAPGTSSTSVHERSRSPMQQYLQAHH